MFVPTRSSNLKSHCGPVHETVVYEHARSQKVDSGLESEPEIGEPNPTTKGNQVRKRKKDDNWTMKKLRYDIIKFGTSGFCGTKKEESKIALAVSLGAEPPKKKYINYKELLKAKEEEKLEKAKLKKFNRNKSFKKSKFKSNSKTNKNSNDKRKSFKNGRNGVNKYGGKHK